MIFRTLTAPKRLEVPKSPATAALDLRPLTLDDQQRFADVLAQYPPETSEIAFGSLFSWNSVLPHFLGDFADHLIVAFRDRDGELKCFQPIGRNPAAVISVLARDYGVTAWTRLSEATAIALFQAGFSVADDRNNWDYIYDLSELRTLVGSRWVTKRNYIHRCRKENPVVRVLEPSMAEDCIRLSREWLTKKGCLTEADVVALSTALRNYQALGLNGLTVSINGQLQAFCLGEPLNAHTYVLHFMKANTEWRGLYQFLFHEFAKQLPASFTMLNNEQDLGIEGLRIAKEDWHPVAYGKKYRLAA